MAPVEPLQDVLPSGTDLFVRQVEHPAEHAAGARLAGREVLVAGHEQARDNAPDVRAQAEIATREQVAHDVVVARRRACCSVDSSASVDSAPWFSLRPRASSPSKPPPLSSSYITVAESFSPRNQAAHSSTAAAQRGSPVSSKARAQASASAATSIGCWSKPASSSPSAGPRPPAG